MDETTLATDGGRFDHRAEGIPAVPALVVTWSVDEPERVGEVLLIDTIGSGVFGRQSGETTGRLRLRRMGPGRQVERGAPNTPTLSRNQLEIEVVQRHVLLVRNRGRGRLLIDGECKDEGKVRPGQVVEIEDQLQFFCTLREPFMAAVDGLAAHAFGRADAFGMVGESGVAWGLRARIHRLAQRDAHVLILGPSGSGKELVATALHSLSTRSAKPLIARNAATFPEGLIDAELFGNVRDYPNAGMRAREGLVGAADGSTLFLDEIGELPSAMQAHLLRVLDNGEYHRLGEAIARRSNLRLVGATNRDESVLKEDFQARFGARLSVGGLDRRREDIPLIVAHLLRAFADEDATVRARFFEGESPRISPGLMRSLVQHPYRTHVRELTQWLWRCVDASSGDFIAPVETEPASGRTLGQDVDLRAGEESLARHVIQQCMDKHNGVQSKVWVELGLRNRHQLARLIKKYNIDVRRDSEY